MSRGNSRDSESMNKNRDKRFLANLQSALGGDPKANNNKLRRSKIAQNHQEEEAITLSDALKKISINGNNNDDVTTSLADVMPFLVERADQFTEDEFLQLANALLDSALDQTNIYFILEICTEMIGHRVFQSSLSECLRQAVGKFLNNEEQFNAIPNVMAQFLSNKWPRMYNRAVENSNLILFTIFNTLMGWIDFLKAQCKEKTQEQDQITSADDGDGDSSLLFFRCVEGLIGFCNTGQRHLWLNYPELFDNIYNTIVEILTSNVNLSRSLKYSLLNLCQQMMKWTQANTKKYLNAATQTVKKEF